MSVQALCGGVVHDVPADLDAALRLRPDALAARNDITPLARNEWICWVENAKRAATQEQADHLGM